MEKNEFVVKFRHIDEKSGRICREQGCFIPATWAVRLGKLRFFGAPIITIQFYCDKHAPNFEEAKAS
jgi:hypothetical protein